MEQEARCAVRRPNVGGVAYGGRVMDEAWNLVRVTRRGVADVGETVVVEGLRPGIFMEVR